MEPFNVVIIDVSGVAKDVHPMGAIPVKPSLESFKNEEKFESALKTFEFDLEKWHEIDATLKTYLIESMRCDSGIIVSNKVLHWHVGKTYKAQDNLEDDFIQIV